MAKKQIVVNITTSNKDQHICHKQCANLIKLDTQINNCDFSCKCFGYDLIEINSKNNPIRLKKCISAEKKYLNLFFKSGNL